MATSALSPAAAKANEKTLSEALAATSISSPKEDGAKSVNGDEPNGEDLEDGEIKEDEEDDGKVKTVFDDADKFNVKVGHLRPENRETLLKLSSAPIVCQLDSILRFSSI